MHNAQKIKSHRGFQNSANGLIKNCLQIILAESRAFHILQRCKSARSQNAINGKRGAREQTCTQLRSPPPTPTFDLSRKRVALVLRQRGLALLRKSANLHQSITTAPENARYNNKYSRARSYKLAASHNDRVLSKIRLGAHKNNGRIGRVVAQLRNPLRRHILV
jgi:hypothetical protein